MIERVDELKKRREAQRTQEVAEKLDRRFREGADELRRVEANVKENMTKIDREKQVMEKHAIMERNFEEEMFYAELWRRDKLNKDRAEAKIAEQKKTKNDARNEILATQYREMQEAKELASAQSQMEKQMLKDQWDLERNKQQKADNEQARLTRKMHDEIRSQNLLHKDNKERIEQAIKDADKERVREIIEKERI